MVRNNNNLRQKKLINNKKHYQINYIKTINKQYLVSKLKSNIIRLKGYAQFFIQSNKNKKIFLKTVKRKFIFYKKTRTKYIELFFLRYYYLQKYKI